MSAPCPFLEKGASFVAGHFLECAAAAESRISAAAASVPSVMVAPSPSAAGVAVLNAVTAAVGEGAGSAESLVVIDPALTSTACHCACCSIGMSIELGTPRDMQSSIDAWIRPW